MQVGKVWLPFSWICSRGPDPWDSSGWKNRVEKRQNMSVQWRTLNIQWHAFELDRLAVSPGLSWKTFASVLT